MRRRGILLEAALALGFYTLAAVVVTWPVADDLGSTVLGVVDSDSAAGIWWLDAIQAHGYHLTGSTRFSEIAYPEGVEQANALNLQWFWAYFPAFLATKVVGAVAAYNLTVISGLALSGAATYLLARRLGASWPVSAWAGLAYLVFPWHVERVVAGHGSLAHLECFPLLALTLLLVYERQSKGRFTLVAGAVLLCWLTSGYYGVMALIMVPVAALAAALVSPPLGRALWASVRVTAVAAGVSGAVYLVTLLGRGGNVGAERTLSDVSNFGLRPVELIVPAPANPLLRRFAPGFYESRKHGSNIQEISNYLGWVTIGLALCWLILVLRRPRGSSRHLRAATAAAGATALATLVFALPGSVRLPRGRHWDLMPSRLLWELVPPFSVPTRWTALLFLAVLVLATLGLQAIYGRLVTPEAGRARSATALGMVAVMLLATFVELRATHPGIHYAASEMPAEYALLAGLPAGALAEYPLVASKDSMNSAYLLRQRGHGRPLLNGAAMGSEGEDVRRALVDPTANGVASELAARGVTAVVTRPATYTRALEIDVPDLAPMLGRGFVLVGATASGAFVWRVTAKPATAFAYLRAPGYSEPMLTQGGPIVQESVGPRGTISVVARRPFEGTLRIRLFARGRNQRKVTIGGVTTTVDAHGTALVIPLRLPIGRTDVPVTIGDVGAGETGVAATAPVAAASRPPQVGH